MVKRLIGKILGKDIAIISDNCCGADICHTFGMRYNSPTVNLQILACDFPRFCANYKYYCIQDLLEIRKDSLLLTDKQNCSLQKTYGRSIDEIDFPIALCGDILLLFQHYNTFNEAKQDWDRRKIRLQQSRVCFLFTLTDCENEFLLEFEETLIPDILKAIITINDDYLCSSAEIAFASIRVPDGVHFMEKKNFFFKYYETKFNALFKISADFCLNFRKCHSDIQNMHHIKILAEAAYRYSM